METGNFIRGLVKPHQFLSRNACIKNHIIPFLTYSKQQRRAVEKKCLERLRGFSNALNNVSQRPQPQQLQLSLLDKRRQSQQSILQHQGPTQVQRHHLMTIPSTITLTPSSANTPSNRIRQPVTVHGGNLKSASGRLGGVVFNRRDSISLPPSPTRSMLIKKETLVSSGTGDPIGNIKV